MLEEEVSLKLVWIWKVETEISDKGLKKTWGAVEGMQQLSVIWKEVAALNIYFVLFWFWVLFFRDMDSHCATVDALELTV